ncbi:MAG: HD-GYP domain-containing protein [Peptococcaceae bacterium]|nr:HD-GYP domain-containing protein [Peptococcaceae bacterium]
MANIIVDAAGRRGFKKMLFNVSQYAITICVSWFVYNLLAADPGRLNLKENFFAMLLSCLTYVLVNFLLVSTIISLSMGKKLSRVLTKDVRLELLHFASLAPVTLLIVILYSVEPLSVLIVLLPLAVAHFSFENYVTLKTETQKTIEVLADIVDKRDSYTAKHSCRVANYCAQIAAELQLRPNEIENLATAARVHDLGKIAVPDSILLKRERLNHEERDVMTSHSLIGYNILKNLRFYKNGAMLVLYHHERFDGGGYPNGLRGDGIPLGARILAVADSYDAMTSDRPYRKALSKEKAMDELIKCAGTQFDPVVVKAFINILQREK